MVNLKKVAKSKRNPPKGKATQHQNKKRQNQDHPSLSTLPFEILYEINHILEPTDSHSLQQTDRIQGTVARAHLDRMFIYDRTLRHRLPMYKHRFYPTQPEIVVQEGNWERATTLQYAVYWGDLVAVRRLITAGCDINETLKDDPDGCARSPLCLAAARGNERIIKVLLRAGAEVELDGHIHNLRGFNPFHVAKNYASLVCITDELERRRRFHRNQ
jgi:ankyrin repeat protein